MRILLALLLAVGLGAASPRTPDDSDPVALITAIYKTYAEDKDKDNPGLPHVYSKRLQALVDKDEKETPEGMVGRIDWDVFVDGQNWKLSGLKIALVSKSATHAQVRATFKNFDHPSNMLFDLALEDGHWRVDDVEKTLKPRWTMSKILMSAPDAFPDAKPEAQYATASEGVSGPSSHRRFGRAFRSDRQTPRTKSPARRPSSALASSSRDCCAVGLSPCRPPIAV